MLNQRQLKVSERTDDCLNPSLSQQMLDSAVKESRHLDTKGDTKDIIKLSQ